jgi:hypothetical protein
MSNRFYLVGAISDGVMSYDLIHQNYIQEEEIFILFINEILSDRYAEFMENILVKRDFYLRPSVSYFEFIEKS